VPVVTGTPQHSTSQTADTSYALPDPVYPQPLVGAITAGAVVILTALRRTKTQQPARLGVMPA
jgi:hypothetical protein